MMSTCTEASERVYVGVVVTGQEYPLPAPSGSKMYCLLQESGVPLPRGKYAVDILYRSETIPEFRFEIY